VNSLQHGLSDSVHVAGAVDATRSHHLFAMNDAALAHGEAAVVTGTHGADLAVHAHLLPLKARALAESERAAMDSFADPALLVELALYDGVLGPRGCGLGKCKGGRCCECRHEDVFK